MISYCGLNCTQCPAFLATQKNDDELRKKVSIEWSREYKADIKPEDINCDGCLSVNGRLFNYCSVCDIRKCAQTKSLKNCGHCSEYICNKLDVFVSIVPEAKATLESIRKDLGK